MNNGLIFLMNSEYQTPHPDPMQERQIYCRRSPNFNKQNYSKTCQKRPLKKRQNKCLHDNWYLNEGRK